MNNYSAQHHTLPLANVLTYLLPKLQTYWNIWNNDCISEQVSKFQSTHLAVIARTLRQWKRSFVSKREKAMVVSITEPLHNASNSKLLWILWSSHPQTKEQSFVIQKSPQSSNNDNILWKKLILSEQMDTIVGLIEEIKTKNAKW